MIRQAIAKGQGVASAFARRDIHVGTWGQWLGHEGVDAEDQSRDKYLVCTISRRRLPYISEAVQQEITLNKDGLNKKERHEALSPGSGSSSG